MAEAQAPGKKASINSSPQANDSLSVGDALFLYLEREGMPLHIASVSVFDGEIDFDQFARHIESKLPLVPRYRQRVQIPPLNLGLPVWRYDPDFDLRNHIRRLDLRRGTNAEFQAEVAKILSQNMDYRRPLWDLTLVCGLQGKRTGLITRVHHCLADGLAGIELMNSLLDSEAAPRRFAVKRARTTSAPTPEAPSLLDALVRSSFSAVQQVLSAHSDFLSLAETLLGSAANNPQGAEDAGRARPSTAPLPNDLGALLPAFAGPAQRLPFNAICRGPQKFHWTEIPVADIKAVKASCGATFNDIALATVLLTVRRYAELHGVNVRSRKVRIVVPVSVRANAESSQLGNRITFLPVVLPLDFKTPQALMTIIREQMMALKKARLAEVVGFAGTLIGTIPTPLQALLGPLVSQLPLSVCNFIFTNVRGSEAPLYLLGRKMLACYPYVPIGGEMGMKLRRSHLQRDRVLRLHRRRPRCPRSAENGEISHRKLSRVKESAPCASAPQAGRRAACCRGRNGKRRRAAARQGESRSRVAVVPRTAYFVLRTSTSDRLPLPLSS